MDTPEEQTLNRELSENAFNTLGLPADANWKTIAKTAELMRQAARSGERGDGFGGHLWYLTYLQFFNNSIPPDEGTIDGALGRLVNPKLRLRERFFWISQPAATLPRHLTIAELRSNTVQQLALREKVINEWLNSADIMKLHDAGVDSLAACVCMFDWETGFDNTAIRCGQTLKLWRSVIESESYWGKLLEIEKHSGFENALSLSEFDGFRSNALNVIETMLVDLTNLAAPAEWDPKDFTFSYAEAVGGGPRCDLDFSKSLNALEGLRLFKQPSAMLVHLQTKILRACEKTFSNVLDEVAEDCWPLIRRENSVIRNAAICMGATKRWKDELAPRFPNLVQMLGSETGEGIHLRRQYCDFLAVMASGLIWAGQFVEAEEVLLLAAASWPTGNKNGEQRTMTVSTIDGPTKVEDVLRIVGPAAAEQRRYIESFTQDGPTKTTPQIGPTPTDRIPHSGGLSKVVGMTELKELLVHEVVQPFRNPELYRQYRVTLPNGILFYGPPGCGKTYIARMLAKELGYHFQHSRPSDVASPYIHDTVLKIRDMFRAAIGKAPSVLFIDEFEAFVPARSDLGGHQQYKAEEVNDFLANLEGCAEQKVLVIAATNEPGKIDSAVRRTGRFDKLIYIPPPDTDARSKMLEFYLAGRPVHESIDTVGIAAMLNGYSASDIKFLVDEAARAALGRVAQISTDILVEAARRVPASITKEDELRYSAFSSRGA